MTNRIIDLRSDTVVKPSEEMLSLMFNSEVGHEGWNEDVNIKTLEREFAKLSGKEDAVFLPSLSIVHILVALSVCKKTDEIIVEFNSHIFQHAASSLASIVGVQLHPVCALNQKYLSLQDILPHVRLFEKYPSTKMIALENPHTIYGGTNTPISVFKEIHEYASSRNIHVYLDGARLLYTCASNNKTLWDYCQYADSVGVCLTKGLGCPYGALLASNLETIKRIRYYKKVLGLNLHYIGYFASAALYALKNNYSMLKSDIQNAKYLYERLNQISLLEVSSPETNIVSFSIKHKLNEANKFVDQLALRNILALNYSGNSIRLVVNATVTQQDIENVIEIINSILREEYLNE